MALSWDLLRGDTSGWRDRSFYLNVVRRSGEPALDVGCGTGRLLLDYMSQGMDLDGVDASPEMLDLCREKATRQGLEPRLYLQPMEALDLPRQYRTIFVPSSSFQLVIDPADAAEALMRFLHHLESGGTFVMSIMDLSKDEYSGGWRLHSEAVRPEDGALVRPWSRATYDVETQLEHTEDRYELIKDREVVQTEHHSRSPATRSYTLEQILKLMEDAGFADVHAVSFATEQPATSDESVFYVFGTRA